MFLSHITRPTGFHFAADFLTPWRVLRGKNGIRLIGLVQVVDHGLISTTFSSVNAVFKQQPATIRFTREKPKEDWLPFLNLQVQLNRGSYRTKWCRIAASKTFWFIFDLRIPSKQSWL